MSLYILELILTGHHDDEDESIQVDLNSKIHWIYSYEIVAGSVLLENIII